MKRLFFFVATAPTGQRNSKEERGDISLCTDQVYAVNLFNWLLHVYNIKITRLCMGKKVFLANQSNQSLKHYSVYPLLYTCY